MFKRIFLLVLAVLLMGGVVYADNPTMPEEDGVILTSGAYKHTPYRTFRLVRVIPGSNYSAAASTDPLKYEVSEDFVMIWWTGTSGSDGITVAPCARISFDSRVAGVMAIDTTVSHDGQRNFQYVTDDVGWTNWGYLQTSGPAYAYIGAAVTAGDLLGTCFAVTGGCAPFMPNEAASTTAKSSTGGIDPARAGVLGFAMDSDAGYAAGDVIRVFLTCE